MYELNKMLKISCCVSKEQAVQKGNQHFTAKCDDLQTWFDMTSHENLVYDTYVVWNIAAGCMKQAHKALLLYM